MFDISEAEIEAAKAWVEKHSKTHCGAAEHWTYKVIQTGLGTIVIVKCACGAEEDVTDYSSWC